MINDLCLVSDVRDVLSLQPSTDPLLLARLVSSASSFWANETNRSYIPTRYVERRNGTGTEILVLKNDPVLLIENLTVDDAVVGPSTDTKTVGYVLQDDSTIVLYGLKSRRGIMNVSCTYWAGFGGKAVEQYVLSAATQKVANSDWFQLDAGVVNLSGQPVSATVDPSQGTYTFDPSLIGSTVVISYWYRDIPGDLQQAIIEIVAMKYKRRQHIDQDTQILGSQNIQFSRTDVPREVRPVIDNYLHRGFIA